MSKKTKIHELFGDNRAKKDEAPKVKVYISEVGGMITVRRSVYINKVKARELEVRPGQHTAYIYSFPKSLDKVPGLDDERYHKTDDPEKRLTGLEREKVVYFFRQFREKQFDREALELREIHDYDMEPVNPLDASLEAADAMKSYQRELHLIARSIDIVEAGAREGLCPAITPKEAERLYQGWQRIYRRLERMGYKQGMFDAQLHVSRNGGPDIANSAFKAITTHDDLQAWKHMIAEVPLRKAKQNIQRGP